VDAGLVGKDAGVTRELKLALIVGLSLVLVVGVLITDHVKKSDAASAVAPMTGDDPSRLTVVGNSGSDPYTPSKQLPEPEPKPKPVPQPEPKVINQTQPDSGKTAQLPDGSQQSSIEDQFTGPTPTAIPDTVYAIQSGDTLYSICKKQYGDASLHNKLSDYNKLTAGKALKLGQKLNLPAKDVLTGKALPYTGKPSTTPAIPSGNKPISDGPLVAASTTVTYKVSSGDTLSSIARKFNTSLTKIRELNPALRGREDSLSVGDELKLPGK
jgi:LysM repeat protein